MDAALSGDGIGCVKAMGGRRHDVMASGRDSALARLAEHTWQALRPSQVALAERGVVVSYGAVCTSSMLRA